MTEVSAVSMDRVALREWITKRPEIAEQLLRVIARRLRRTNNMLADLIFTDVPERVAKALLGLVHDFGTQEAGMLRVTHDLTQEEIVQLVGASRELECRGCSGSTGWWRHGGVVLPCRFRFSALARLRCGSACHRGTALL